MYIDILIFALIAAFLIYRLNAVLGSRHGEERQRRNPFDPAAEQKKPIADEAEGVLLEGEPMRENVVPLAGAERHIDAASNQDGRIETGLRDIADVDSYFEINSFMQGARGAFEMIVLSYSRGDLDTLRPLLSPKLFADFAAGVKAREAAEDLAHKLRATENAVPASDPPDAGRHASGAAQTDSIPAVGKET